jgi:nucleotide-binding universal stress UspA family protein
VKESDPADTILEVAEAERADLMVLGLRKPGDHAKEVSHLPFAITHQVIARASRSQH